MCCVLAGRRSRSSEAVAAAEVATRAVAAARVRSRGDRSGAAVPRQPELPALPEQHPLQGKPRPQTHRRRTAPEPIAKVPQS